MNDPYLSNEIIIIIHNRSIISELFIQIKKINVIIVIFYILEEETIFLCVKLCGVAYYRNWNKYKLKRN